MFAFVVLHYMVYRETINCVDSLLKQKYKDMVVVIVDNGSTNNSYSILKDKYANSTKVHIIRNEFGKGFSNGNNFGAEYILNNFEADYICFLNNDTYIDDDSFIDKIIKKNAVSHFDVLGPAIYNTNLKCYQNPITMEYNLEALRSEVRFETKLLKLLQSPFYFLYYPIVKLSKRKNVSEESTLAGAALVFSKRYIDLFQKNIFPEYTEFYGEEAFIHWRCKTYNLTEMYFDKVLVYHNHAVATKSQASTLRKKWTTITQRTIQARRALIQVIENGETNETK